MDPIILFILWIMFASVAGVIVHNKGRSGFGLLALGVLVVLTGCGPPGAQLMVVPAQPANGSSTDMSVVRMAALKLVDDGAGSATVQGIVRNVSDHNVCVLKLEFALLDRQGQFVSAATTYVLNQGCLVPGGEAVVRIYVNKPAGAHSVALVSGHWRPKALD